VHVCAGGEAVTAPGSARCTEFEALAAELCGCSRSGLGTGECLLQARCDTATVQCAPSAALPAASCDAAGAEAPMAERCAACAGDDAVTCDCSEEGAGCVLRCSDACEAQLVDELCDEAGTAELAARMCDGRDGVLEAQTCPLQVRCYGRLAATSGGGGGSPPMGAIRAGYRVFIQWTPSLAPARTT
jgi:hypothetical protein